VLVNDMGYIANVLPVEEMDVMVAALKARGEVISQEVECDGRAVLPGRWPDLELNAPRPGAAVCRPVPCRYSRAF
jgi:hypothetical protein